MRRFIFLTSLVGLLFVSCSSAPVVPSVSVARFYFDTLRLRRPVNEPADPSAGAGGIDFRTVDSQSVSDQSCESLKQFFSSMNFQRLADCVKQSGTAIYQLRRSVQPAFVLLNDEKEPPLACLLRELPEIPVPRELIFQVPASSANASAWAYASRLDLDADRFLGIRMPWIKTQLQFKFPLEIQPQEEILRQWLFGLTLAPFITTMNDEVHIVARLLPDPIAMRCIGEKSWVNPTPHSVRTARVFNAVERGIEANENP